MTDPIIAIEVPPPAGAHQPAGPDVVLYPETVHADRGTYSVAAAGFLDELVEAGVDARPYHDLAHSDWPGEREPLWLLLILGVASEAAWDAIKKLLGRRSNSGKVTVTVGFQHDGQTRWVHAEGDGRAVADALDKVKPWG
jgi:hypothetical protein